MTDLSPTAQAVLDAVASQLEGGWISPEFIPYEARKIAAALRAAADQVVPEESDPDPIKAWSIDDWNHMNITRYQREETRRELLAIAAELEGKSNEN